MSESRTTGGHPERTEFHDTRAWIRAIASVTGAAGALDTVTGAAGALEVRDTPTALFLDWLTDAVEAGVVEPHAATLSTVDEAGAPDARFLLLKDVTDRGFWFSGDTRSPKGVELERDPRAALTFYWREAGRQVRVRGMVENGGDGVSARDFLERSVTARAVATVSRQSEVLADPEEYDRRVAAAVDRIDGEPDFVSETWRAWCLVPDTVEFWQADPGRRHLRHRYARAASGWTVDQLWP